MSGSRWDAVSVVAGVLSNPVRVDARTIEHIDAVLWQCQRQDDALGPRAVLDAVLAQRDFAQALLPGCSAELRPRLLSVLSSASRQAGWLCFDLNDFDSAGYYYEDARARARAYAADVTARACAADGQRTACLTALDAAHTALTKFGDQQPGYIRCYDEALHISVRGWCHLELHDGQPAVEYGQQSLGKLDPSRTRSVAMTIVDIGRAYAQCHEIDEAARLLGDAGEIAARNSSARLAELLKQGRADLWPWNDSAAVRALDDRLMSCGVV